MWFPCLLILYFALSDVICYVTGGFAWDCLVCSPAHCCSCAVSELLISFTYFCCLVLVCSVVHVPSNSFVHLYLISLMYLLCDGCYITAGFAEIVLLPCMLTSVPWHSSVLIFILKFILFLPSWILFAPCALLITCLSNDAMYSFEFLCDCFLLSFYFAAVIFFICIVCVRVLCCLLYCFTWHKSSEQFCCETTLQLWCNLWYCSRYVFVRMWALRTLSTCSYTWISQGWSYY